MQSTDCDVLIVGGGVVGATLACALLQGGMRVIIVEAKPITSTGTLLPKINDHSPQMPEYDLRTFALTRASEQILTHLKVWDKITSQRVSPFREMHVWDAGGVGEIHFDSATLNEPTLGYIVEQRVIQSALISQLAEFENLTTYRPAQVQSFNLLENEAAMQVHLDNKESLTTHLLVSAEGANSSIRTKAGIQFQLRDHGQQAIVATVQTEKPHQETAWQRFLLTGPLALLPLSESDTSSIVWSIDTPLAQHLMTLEKEAFHIELEKALAFKLGKVKDTSQRAAFPLQSRHVLNYVQPRLALVGDAAHSILPLAGQGLNLGLLDAAALTEVVLNAKARNGDVGSYRELRRYERWRKGDNFAMMKLMEGFKYLFSTPSTLLTLTRNVGLNLTNTTTPIKQIITQYAMGLTGDLPRLAQRGWE
jgi:2-octaprenylphenol hydroxylase